MSSLFCPFISIPCRTRFGHRFSTRCKDDTAGVNYLSTFKPINVNINMYTFDHLRMYSFIYLLLNDPLFGKNHQLYLLQLHDVKYDLKSHWPALNPEKLHPSF